MEIRNFRPVKHDTIKANFNIYIEEWDLYLNKMVLLQTAKGKFVSSPSDRYEKDGETKYFPYYAFGKDSNKKFQDKVMDLIKVNIEEMEGVAPDVKHEREFAEDLPF